LLVSGRGGFEIAQKALAADIPILASVSPPSSLRVKLARELGLTLVGILRGRRFVAYAGEFRCLTQDPQPWFVAEPDRFDRINAPTLQKGLLEAETWPSYRVSMAAG
jgi:hypothetical protein